MATVPQCDRCKNFNVQVVPVLGVDLCRRCVDAFRDWASNAARMGSDGRAGFRQRHAQAEEVINRDGHVTSVTLANVAGITRVQANHYLHARAKQGALTFLGKGRFVLSAKDAAE